MIKINAIASCYGSIKEQNNDIESLVGWDAKDIFIKTGIKHRYIADKNESAESLALKALEKIDSCELIDCDLIISVSNTQLKPHNSSFCSQ